MPRLTISAIALALASPAFADTEDTALPPTAWSQDFLGTYAIGGACGEPEQTWVLTDFQADMGGIRCSAFGKMTFHNGGLVVPMSQCREGATLAPDRRITFLRGEDERLTATDGTTTLNLIPCPGGTPVQ